MVVSEPWGIFNELFFSIFYESIPSQNKSVILNSYFAITTNSYFKLENTLFNLRLRPFSSKREWGVDVTGGLTLPESRVILKRD